MEKIYGYKEKDVLGLAEFLKEKGNLSLTEIFERYSKVSGKAKGTVRNLYYALAKRSQKDKEIRDRYLGGKALKVNSVINFDEQEEKELIKKILLGKKEGNSVRSVILELANGDGKLALRYQNKYRGALKNKPDSVYAILDEINVSEKDKSAFLGGNKSAANLVTDLQLKKLKNEINSLIYRLTEKDKKENAWLKERLANLEIENLRLKTALYGSNGKSATLKYFSRRNNNGGSFGGGTNGLN